MNRLREAMVLDRTSNLPRAASRISPYYVLRKMARRAVSGAIVTCINPAAAGFGGAAMLISMYVAEPGLQLPESGT